MIAALVVAVLVGVTLYVGWLVRASLRESVRDSLQTVLAANTAALELWLSHQRATAIQFANDDSVRSASLAILKEHARRPVQVNGTVQVDDSDQTGQPSQIDANLNGLRLQNDRLQSTGYMGWAIADRLGTILRSSDVRFDGALIPLTGEQSDRLSTGDALVTRPFEIDSSTETGASDRTVATVMICAIAPLQSDHQTMGSLALMIDPSKQLSEILSVAQMGDSGETYVFDHDAVLLSQSRFESQLIQVGLLAEGQSSPLKIHIRQPEFDIRNATSFESDPRAWPMTQMADRATRGGDGFDVAGYKNYRGALVVGAWRWLPEYEIGIATEIDVDEAFIPLRILRNSFLALLGAVALAGTILFGLAWSTRPRETHSERVEELRRRLGQYDLQQRIGRGGMGTVYLGEHGLLDRKVAIKVLENSDATERSLARFQREVQLSARLKHPNTIEIYDFGRTDEGTFFYVMEFVDGISLEQLVNFYGRQPAERVIYLLLQICGSISEAHLAGLVHRDIKPANVLLTSRSGIHDLIKVVDFGLAKQLDHDSMQLTRVDSLTGTPLFMSPESIRDAASADVRSDLYSIGAVGYTLLCGFAPFDGESSTEVCARKLHEEPELPERKINVSLAHDLQDLLLRCLSLDPEKRPQSAQQLASDLLACSDSPHWNQQDAALWWREVFDGPYLDDFEINDASKSADGTQGETAVNEKRPAASALDQSMANETGN